MTNFIKILLQFDSFKTHFMKIQLSFIILRKISVRVSQFKNTFSQKHRQILRYLCNVKIL